MCMHNILLSITYFESPEIRNLAKVKPEQYKALLDAIDMHIKEHEKFQQEKQQRQCLHKCQGWHEYTPTWARLKSKPVQQIGGFNNDIRRINQAS